MSSIPLAEAQARLPQLIADLRPGEEVVLVQNGSPVARLIRSGHSAWPCQPGSAKHLPHWMAPDFDAPLEDFRDYMK